MNIAERFVPQDGHIQINHRGSRVDIRVGTMLTIYGESLVMRPLEKNSKVLTTEELGLDKFRANLLVKLVEKAARAFSGNWADWKRQDHDALRGFAGAFTRRNSKS